MEKIVERNNVVLAEANGAARAGAVSWAAVFAGALAAAALSLVLFILGFGLGLGAVSPWSNEGISGEMLGVSTIVWITITSLLASGLGGYLTGRLRTRWLNTHVDEVHFRDTAHGLLAWSLATLLTAVLFTTTTVGAIGMGADATAAVAGEVSEVTAAATGALAGEEGEGSDSGNPLRYYLDSLFRTTGTADVQTTAPDAPGITQAEQREAADVASTEEGAESLTPEQQAALSAGGAGPETMVLPEQGQDSAQGAEQGGPGPMLGEVARIFARALRNEELPEDDMAYVGRLVSRYTGLTPMEAELRVTRIFQSAQTELRELEMSAREAAEEVSSVSSKIALWFFVALLSGAFIASLAATIGGRQRDQ